MKITEKYVPNLILSILLVFSLIGTAAAMIAKYYIISEDTFMENVDENNIAELTYNEIEKYFNGSEAYSGIPADVYMSAITKEDIATIINIKISENLSLITNFDKVPMEPISYENLERSISDYFDKFAHENNVEINDDYNNQLKKTIDTAISEVDEFCDVYMLDFMYKKNIIDKAADIYIYIDPIMYIFMGLSVLCIILICGISRKKIRNAFYWISMSLICSSALMLLPTLYVKFSGLAERFIIRNETIYTAITSLISKVLNTMCVTELVMLAVGAVLVILCAVTSKKDEE